MTVFKNVRPHPVDAGGRMLAAGEIADLDDQGDAVADLVTDGSLLEVTQPADRAGGAPKQRGKQSGQSGDEGGES